MNLGGIAFKVCLHLGVNPDRSLTSRQICDMFHVERTRCVRTALMGAINADWVVNASKGGRGNKAVYKAGPRLLRMRGAE